MTDLDTDDTSVRLIEPAAHRAVVRRRRAATAAAPEPVTEPDSGPVGLLDVTTELEPYVESESEPEHEPVVSVGPDFDSDFGSAHETPANPVLVTAPSGRRHALARLDARTAARPFPDAAIGSDTILVEPRTLVVKQPLLVRLLRLQHVRPTGWQRAAVGDLPILIAVLLVLSDLATAWTLLVLPVVVLMLVKFHDVIESRLVPLPAARPPERPFGDLEPGV